MGFYIKLLNGENPSEQYDAIDPHDDHTFYLLSNGIGYLGDQLLFDATNSGSDSVIELAQEINEEEPEENKAASIAAIVDYVAAKCNAIDALRTHFFRGVESYMLTEENMEDENVLKPEGCKAGDVGLIFIADMDDDEENENQKYWFIPLTDYLNTVYTFQESESIIFEHDPDGNIIRAQVKINTETMGEVEFDADGNPQGIFYCDENGLGLQVQQGELRGCYGIPDMPEEDASEMVLMTEASLANFIMNRFIPFLDERYAQFSQDDGTEE